MPPEPEASDTRLLISFGSMKDVNEKLITGTISPDLLLVCGTQGAPALTILAPEAR